MAFKLGDVIIDRLQFGYGALADKALYALTQLQNATIDITADSTDVKDKDGNLVYRKYSGKTGEITATNAFLNLAIAEIVSATDAEVATAEKAIVMPIFKIVKAGETLDITDAVADSFVVNALSTNGSLGKAYTKGADVSPTEFKVDADANTLTPPTDTDEVQYLVKFKKNVKSGAKITISGDKYPKAHELYFKALAVDKCNVMVVIVQLLFTFHHLSLLQKYLLLLRVEILRQWITRVLFLQTHVLLVRKWLKSTSLTRKRKPNLMSNIEGGYALPSYYI